MSKIPKDDLTIVFPANGWLPWKHGGESVVRWIVDSQADVDFPLAVKRGTTQENV